MLPSGKNPPVVAVTGISKSFGNGRVVANVSLYATAGMCLGLLGPNGAGKSTTLKIIYGFLRPDGGKVSVCGLDLLRDLRAAKRCIGVVPQDDTLDPELTGMQTLLFHARYFGYGGAEARERAACRLEQAGLLAYRDAAIGNLSSGLRRRLVLARALLSEPQVVILDEPTRGLDRGSREQFLEQLMQMKRGGTTLVLATHEWEEAGVLCDHAVIMEAGRVVGQGPAGAVLGQARDRNLLVPVQGGAVC